jgi:hypothetical protein
MSSSNAPKQYLVGTCLCCKKCLYCGVDLSTRKKTCSCDKTIKPSKNNRTDKVKVVFTRVSSPDLPPEPLKYIQDKVTHFGYSLNLKTKFNFTLCTTCNSTFQRKRNSSRKTNSNSSIIPLQETLAVNSGKDSLESDDTSIEFDNIDETEQINEAEKVISFNLVIKPSTGPSLPSKWVEIEASSLDDVLAEIHYYIRKLTHNKEIDHSDYLVTFKPEKAAGVGAQLVDIHDYKKFHLDYKKLLEAKKNMTIIVSIKKKEKQKRKEVKIHLSLNFYSLLHIE